MFQSDRARGAARGRCAETNGARDWSRTSTSLRTLGPEPSASTNSATWAQVRAVNSNEININLNCGELLNKIGGFREVITYSIGDNIKENLAEANRSF